MYNKEACRRQAETETRQSQADKQDRQTDRVQQRVFTVLQNQLDLQSQAEKKNQWAHQDQFEWGIFNLGASGAGRSPEHVPGCINQTCVDLYVRCDIWDGTNIVSWWTIEDLSVFNLWREGEHSDASLWRYPYVCSVCSDIC